MYILDYSFFKLIKLEQLEFFFHIHPSGHPLYRSNPFSLK